VCPYPEKRELFSPEGRDHRYAADSGRIPD
jgi:hypothetical protein